MRIEEGKRERVSGDAVWGCNVEYGTGTVQLRWMWSSEMVPEGGCGV